MEYKLLKAYVKLAKCACGRHVHSKYIIEHHIIHLVAFFGKRKLYTFSSINFFIQLMQMTMSLAVLSLGATADVTP